MINVSYWSLATLLLLLGLMSTSLGGYALYSSLRNGQRGKLYYQAAIEESSDVRQTLERQAKRIDALEAEREQLALRLETAEREIQRLETENAKIGSALRRLVTQVQGMGKEPDIEPILLQRLGRGE